MWTLKLTWRRSNRAVSALSSLQVPSRFRRWNRRASTISVSRFKVPNEWVKRELDGKRIDPKRAEKRNAKIFCGGLKSDFDDEAIKQIFAEHGEIELYERFVWFRSLFELIIFPTDALIVTPADPRPFASSHSKMIRWRRNCAKCIGLKLWARSARSRRVCFRLVISPN